MREDTLDFYRIRQLLLGRGTTLNAGMARDRIVELTRKTGLQWSPLMLNLYASFNGFPPGVTDGGSGIRLWPLQEVLDPENMKQVPRLTFADFLMGSDEISANVTDCQEPVFYRETGEKISDRLSEFIISLAEGRMDFM